MQNLAAAFVKAQKSFGPALKNATNPYFKRKYADLGSCIDAVLAALNDHGIGVLQFTHLDRDGVVVETNFLHASGEMLSAGKMFMPVPKADPQVYGSALTYARRYSLMAACCIAAEDDDGEKASRVKAMKGADHDWQISVSVSPEAQPEDWVSIVSEATTSGLGFCSSVDEVMTLFRVNRNIYDELKNLDATVYQELMSQFSKTKSTLKDAK